MRARNLHGNYTNPCLTMHQPWASLLVHGIKRIEGRSWPAPIRGRLWIHAASKVPDDATIEAMEDFYRAIYAVNGITDLKFPEHYPVSRLLGCVEVVGCIRCEELASWEEVPEGVRLEGQTDFCWLCEQPQKLLVPFEMRGYQGVYNLEKRIYEAAVRGLTPVESPLPVKFPLPNPRDPFSLKPGSISAHFNQSKVSEVEKSSSLSAAIAGARAAATQFSKKDHNIQGSTSENRNISNSTKTGYLKGKSLEGTKLPASNLDEISTEGTSVLNKNEQSSHSEHGGDSSSRNQLPHADLNPHPTASPKASQQLVSIKSGCLRNFQVNNSSVEVVGCIRCEELASWEEVPEGVRLEGQTDFCWLCEKPQKLLVPFEMRGYQGVYNLEKRIYEAAVRGLTPVESPLQVKFPLPNPRDPFSLKPGSISAHFNQSKVSEVEKSSSLSAAIAGARAAATQFSKKDHNIQGSISENRNISNSTKTGYLKGKSLEGTKLPASNLDEISTEGTSVLNKNEQSSHSEHGGDSSSRNQLPHADLNPHPTASPKLFSAALRGLRHS